MYYCNMPLFHLVPMRTIASRTLKERWGFLGRSYFPFIDLEGDGPSLKKKKRGRQLSMFSSVKGYSHVSVNLT